MKGAAGVAVVSVCMVLVGAVYGETKWPCTYSFTESYDLYPISNVTYSALDVMANEYFFRLCDPTTVWGDISSSTPCADETQVCQDQQGSGTSCGLGPPAVSELLSFEGVSTTGLVMETESGTVGCGNVARSTTLNVVCVRDFPGKTEGETEVQEDPQCTYTVNLYTGEVCAQSSPAALCCIYGNSTETQTCVAMDWSLDQRCIASSSPLAASFPVDNCEQCFQSCN